MSDHRSKLDSLTSTRTLTISNSLWPSPPIALASTPCFNSVDLLLPGLINLSLHMNVSCSALHLSELNLMTKSVSSNGKFSSDERKHQIRKYNCGDDVRMHTLTSEFASAFGLIQHFPTDYRPSLDHLNRVHFWTSIDWVSVGNSIYQDNFWIPSSRRGIINKFGPWDILAYVFWIQFRLFNCCASIRSMSAETSYLFDILS